MSAVWCEDDTFLGDLIFLNESNLVIDSPGDDQAENLKSALLSGTPAAQVLGSDSVDIPLLAITSIRTDRNDEDIEIEYRRGKETVEHTLRMSSPEKRDEVYAALKQVFGEKFTESEDAYSAPRAALGSLTALTVFGLLTWGGAYFARLLRAAEDYEISGGKQGVKQLIAWIFEFLGPTGVHIIGGLFCALSALSLYSRVMKPQVMLILQEAPYRRGSGIVLTAKYGVLLFVWYLVARVAAL